MDIFAPRPGERGTLGSLFSGFGGLDLAVRAALGPMRTAWVSDIEPGPCAILARRFPGAPNIGDVTAVDWGDLDPVDVLAGGSPCPDLSVAGKRLGMLPGTRSGLWESMALAVQTLHPHLVIWENVRGALSARAFSLVESSPGRLGDLPERPLRALGRVLGDLANLGFDARWCGLPASDVGAPHRRFRVFVAAWPRGDDWWIERALAADPDGPARHERRLAAAREAPGGWARPDAGGPDRAPVTHLPTPRSLDGRLSLRSPSGLRHVQAGYGNLPEVIGARLLPTPTARDHKGRNQRDDDTCLPGAIRHVGNAVPDAGPRFDFKDYAPAVRRWEAVTGRRAPSPVIASARQGGRPTLSPLFVEWMMGLPPAWVTDPAIWAPSADPDPAWFDLAFEGVARGMPGRPRQVRALGNGVVPQQGTEAIRRIAAEELLWRQGRAASA